MLYGKSVFGMIISSIGCIRAANQGNINFGGSIQIVVFISICMLFLIIFNRLFLADATNVKLAILLNMITVRATIVGYHRGLLLSGTRVIIVALIFP
jgi:hypothetical protein